MVPTRDHDVIRQWAERTKAFPAQIRRLKFDGEPAILTFLFGEPGDNHPEIQTISWDTFFAQFELLGLSLAFEECGKRFVLVKAGGPTAGYPRYADEL